MTIKNCEICGPGAIFDKTIGDGPITEPQELFWKCRCCGSLIPRKRLGRKPRHTPEQRQRMQELFNQLTGG